MKKTFFIFLATFCVLIGRSNLQADPANKEIWQGQEREAFPHTLQEKSFVRRAKGMHGVGIIGGVSSIGVELGLEWSYQFSSSSQFRLLFSSGWGRWKRKARITARSLNVQPIVYHTFLTDYDRFCLNGGLGVTVGLTGKYRGWKRIKTERKPTASGNGNQSTQESAFNAGVVIAGEIEVFIVKTLELTLAGGPIINILKGSQDRVAYFLVVGIKINL